MTPLLRLAADGEEYSLRGAIEQLAEEFHLSEQDRKELLPSGGQATFDNRVGWARTYMKKAGLLETPKRGYLKITDKGLEALKHDKVINVKFLEQYPEFIEFHKGGSKEPKPAAPPTESEPEQTPLEAIETAYETVRGGLVSELLEQVM